MTASSKPFQETPLKPEEEPNNLTPAERLSASRERLRHSLMESSTRKSRKGLAPKSTLLEGLSAIPGVGLVIDSVRGWWSQHPMRLAVLVASDAAKSMVKPVARSNPLGLVFGALAVGAVLVWARPWRGLLRPALFAGIVPQLISRALSQVPVESWMSAALTVFREKGSPAATQKAAAAKPEASVNRQQQQATAPSTPVRNVDPLSAADEMGPPRGPLH